MRDVLARIRKYWPPVCLALVALAVVWRGPAQVGRLKGTLRMWLVELLGGTYDREYVARRWQVGLRHAEIGLDQVYTHAALARVRHRLIQHLCDVWDRSPEELALVLASLNRLLDLDLAIIEDAYHAAYALREKQMERLAVIGQMAGGIAHELRNPLNVVRTSVYYLQTVLDAPEAKRAEHWDRITQQMSP